MWRIYTVDELNMTLCIFSLPKGGWMLISYNWKPKVDNDLRPVTLTAILAKCFERALLPKVTAYTQPVMEKLQFA